MNLIIENLKFDYNLGCKILKCSGGDCPINGLEDIWDSIEPITFKEIAEITNTELRRVAFKRFGLERLISEVNPVLVDSQTISKTTTWINENGIEETITFSDTYELYKVEGSVLFPNERWRRVEDVYYIKCKDTSTEREYLIWVNVNGVFRANNADKGWIGSSDIDLNAINCIAWTIQTNVPIGNIETIIRQGDCILIKPTNDERLNIERHLSGKEYLELLELES
jgi:hypothetical protein